MFTLRLAFFYSFLCAFLRAGWRLVGVGPERRGFSSKQAPSLSLYPGPPSSPSQPWAKKEASEGVEFSGSR